MGINLSIISEIKAIRDEKSKLAEKESGLTNPVLNDFSLLPLIYQCFKDILKRQDPEPCIDGPYQKKKFIFIALYLYAPEVLAGSKMPAGLRKGISETMQINNPAYVSQNIETVVFWFQNDKEFQENISHIYDEMENMLHAKGLVK